MTISPVTDQHIDAVYDAMEMMALFGQILRDGEINDKMAGEMAWLLGSAKARLEPALGVLEKIHAAEVKQPGNAPGEDDLNLLSEVLALTARFERRRKGLSS